MRRAERDAERRDGERHAAGAQDRPREQEQRKGEEVEHDDQHQDPASSYNAAGAPSHAVRSIGRSSGDCSIAFNGSDCTHVYNGLAFPGGSLQLAAQDGAGWHFDEWKNSADPNVSTIFGQVSDTRQRVSRPPG